MYTWGLEWRLLLAEVWQHMVATNAPSAGRVIEFEHAVSLLGTILPSDTLGELLQRCGLAKENARTGTALRDEYARFGTASRGTAADPQSLGRRGERPATESAANPFFPNAAEREYAASAVLSSFGAPVRRGSRPSARNLSDHGYAMSQESEWAPVSACMPL